MTEKNNELDQKGASPREEVDSSETDRIKHLNDAFPIDPNKEIRTELEGHGL